MLSSTVFFHSDQSSEIEIPTESAQFKIKGAQQQLYDFFLGIVQQWTVDQILNAFEQLFFHLSCPQNSQIVEGLNRIIVEQDEDLFRDTLKRCIYILINNWRIHRDYASAQQLIQRLEEYGQKTQSKTYISPSINCLRIWLCRFIQSPDFKDIQNFALSQPQDWTQRYQSYLLIPPTVKASSKEQQQAALKLAQEIKEKYKFDLAMYITRSESSSSLKNSHQNPTKLGNDVIKFIKKTLFAHDFVNDEHQAELFLEKTTNTPYTEFKTLLLNYLTLLPDSPYPLCHIREKFCKKLYRLEINYSDRPIDKSAIAIACQKLIQVLTTENDKSPSSCFTILISQRHYLILVNLLLKLVLISRSCQKHLEYKIANLIHYYQGLEEDKCQKFIHFLEVFNLMFTVFTTNLKFHLVKVNPKNSIYQSYQGLDNYRLFCQLKGPDLRQANLKTANLNNRDLRGADLRGKNLQGLELIRTDLRLANLSQANLSQGTLNEANLPIANLMGTNLTEASLVKANLRRANLQQANLTQASLTGAKLDQTNLFQAQLKQANLMAADLKRSDLRNTDLSGANLESADLRKADLSGANLGGACLRGANLKGAKLWSVNLSGADLRETNLCQTHLDQANLSHSDLSGANLTQAELNGTNFAHAKLNQANFQQADGIAANLESTELRHTCLTEASFSGANFSNSDLTRANLQKADLSGANLSWACIRHTLLNHTNLSDANLQGANLFGSNLKQAILNQTQFGDNSGLSEDIKCYLKIELAGSQYAET